MDCHEVRDSLEAYAAGELEPTLAGRLEQHLDSCPECSMHYESLRTLTADLRHASHAVRPIQSFSVPELALPHRRPSVRRLAWAFAAVAGAWAVLMTVLVLAPSVSERFSLFPAGKTLRDARVAARGDRAQSLRLQKANLLLQQKLTAAHLGVPLDAVVAAEKYLASAGTVVAGGQRGAKLTWTLLSTIPGPHQPFSASSVTLKAVTHVPQAAGGSPKRVELKLRLVRTSGDAWVASPIPR